MKRLDASSLPLLRLPRSGQTRVVGRRFAAAIGLGLTILLAPAIASAHQSHNVSPERLPLIRQAPDFTLTSQDNAPVALASLRGKVFAVTFIYTSCTDTCPVLTAVMATVQKKLGADFGARISFVSISIDPDHDTPEVLKDYAEAFGADLPGWSFLTGARAAIREVARQYGVAAIKTAQGVDHTFLTSLVDRQGMLRVQYVGVSFDPEEFRHDLLNLLHEP